jgi:hypothetical protein
VPIVFEAELGKLFTLPPDRVIDARTRKRVENSPRPKLTKKQLEETPDDPRRDL